MGSLPTEKDLPQILPLLLASLYQTITSARLLSFPLPTAPSSFPKSPAQHLSVLIHMYQIPPVTCRSTWRCFESHRGSFLSCLPRPQPHPAFSCLSVVSTCDVSPTRSDAAQTNCVTAAMASILPAPPSRTRCSCFLMT